MTSIIKEIFNIIFLYIKSCNKALWIICITLTVYGLVIIKSIDLSGNTNFFKTQFTAVIIGFIIAVTISLIDYKNIVNLWWIFAIASIILTVWVSLAGIQVYGTDDTAWIRLPGGYTFQPSEFTKIFFIITLSAHISYLHKINKIKSFIGVISLVIHCFVPIITIHIQGDDGAVIIFAIIFLIMCFCGGVQIRYFIITGIAIAVSIPFIWNIVLNTSQKERILVLFSHENEQITSYGWQQYQGKISIASGGLNGYGLFNGKRVATNIVPYQENDFIFSVIGEELGFVGCGILLLLFIALCGLIIIIGIKSQNIIGELLSLGSFALISSQFIINIAMVMGFLPVIGITLPFFSAGGTSVISIYMCVGLLQSIARKKQSSFTLG